MNRMSYRGYDARVDYDEEADILHGEVVNLRDVITFQARSVDDLKSAFHDSIEDYRAFCKERGEEPEEPYIGQFMMRLEPTLHQAAADAARTLGLSLDRWIAEQLEKALAS